MKNAPAKYISCMKLNGLPILPPIITPEYRKLLYCYQQQAIAVEKRLSDEAAVHLLNNISETLTTQEQTLAFNVPSECFKRDPNICRVPCNLTCDIQVSQYTNNQFKVITHNVENELNSSIEQSESAERSEANNNEPLRRNSYTLDGPSPFLIDKFANIDTFNASSKCSMIGSEHSTTDKSDDITNKYDMDLYCDEMRLRMENVEIISGDMKDENMNIEEEIHSLDNDLKRINSSSDTDTELMNLSFHSSIESHINPLHDDLSALINTDNNNHELYKLLTDTPTHYSHKLLALLRRGDVASPVVVGREQWAATVIVAWSRGHLVRRLLRSAHVQRLVDTIRAALICAVQLHGETEDRIEAADVELHRRLIQQVSAACCDFHDVFFAVPVAERLRIIRSDGVARRKRKVKVCGTEERRAATSSRRSGGGRVASRRLFPPFANLNVSYGS